MLILLTCLACAVWPVPRGIELTDVELVPVKHAAQVPLRRFETPVSPGLSEEDCRSTPARRLTFAVLEVTRSGIRFAGNPVKVEVNDGVIHDMERRGQLVPVLYGELLDAAEGARHYAERGCLPEGRDTFAFNAELLLSIDATVPSSTVQQVVFTAQQAQYRQFRIRVTDPSPTHALPAKHAGARPGAELVRIDIGSRVSSIHRPGREILQGDLRLQLPQALRTLHTPILLAPAPQMSTRDFLRAMDVIVGATAPVPLVLSVSHDAAIPVTTQREPQASIVLPRDASVAVLSLQHLETRPAEMPPG